MPDKSMLRHNSLAKKNISSVIALYGQAVMRCSALDWSTKVLQGTRHIQGCECVDLEGNQHWDEASLGRSGSRGSPSKFAPRNIPGAGAHLGQSWHPIISQHVLT